MVATESAPGLMRPSEQEQESDSDDCSTPSTKGLRTPSGPSRGASDDAAEDRFGGTRARQGQAPGEAQSTAEPQSAAAPVSPPVVSDKNGNDEGDSTMRPDNKIPPVLLGRMGNNMLAEIPQLRIGGKEAGAKPAVPPLQVGPKESDAQSPMILKDRRSLTAKSCPVSDLMRIEEIQAPPSFHGGRAPRPRQQTSAHKTTLFLRDQGYIDVHDKKVVKDRRKCTFSYPLHGAVRCGDAEVVGLLLRANASSAAIDSEGLTPLQLARKLDEVDSHRAMIELFSSNA